MCCSCTFVVFCNNVYLFIYSVCPQWHSRITEGVAINFYYKLAGWLVEDLSNVSDSDY